MDTKEQANSTKPKRGCLATCLGLLGVVILLSFINGTLSSVREKAREAERVENQSSEQIDTTVKNAEASARPASYEVVETQGQRVSILIPSSYLNEAQMIQLGEQLKKEYESETLIRVSVYTDREAAKLFSKTATDELTAKQTELYDSHYVGQYNKNTATGLHKYTIYFDGLSGSNTKTIDY